MDESATGHFDHCTFRYNQAFGSGGALLSSGRALVQRSLFAHNMAAAAAGAIAVSASTADSAHNAIIVRCRFLSNKVEPIKAALRTVVDGGGVSVSSLAHANLTGNTFEHNFAGRGGAIATSSQKAVIIVRNKFYANVALSAAGPIKP